MWSWLFFICHFAFLYYNLVFFLKLKNKNNCSTVGIRLEIVFWISFVNFLLDLLRFYKKINDSSRHGTQWLGLATVAYGVSSHPPWPTTVRPNRCWPPPTVVAGLQPPCLTACWIFNRSYNFTKWFKTYIYIYIFLNCKKCEDRDRERKKEKVGNIKERNITENARTRAAKWARNSRRP
jgi:hypothetical protein